MSISEHTVYNPDKPRIKTLDSLRGFAALAVVISHCLGNINYNEKLDKTPLYFFKAAHEAVIFFFLLSGYVLVYQYESKRKFNYGEFIVLRICRIYIPYIISILFAITLYTVFNSGYVDFTFLGHFWNGPLNTSLIVDHFIMIGNFNTDSLNPVIWSLVHEMRVAIVFPLLLFIIRLKPFTAISIGLIISIISAILIVIDINPSKGYNNGYFYTSYYFFIFMLGGIIVKNQDALLLKYEGLARWGKNLLIFIALLIYTYAHTFLWVLAKLHLPRLMHFSFVFEDLLTTIAAGIFIIIAIQQSKKRTFLDSKIPLFFGKISYSLYLVHLVILVYIFKQFHNKDLVFFILLPGLIISVIFAKIFNFLIERNAIRLGKRLTIHN